MPQATQQFKEVLQSFFQNLQQRYTQFRETNPRLSKALVWTSIVGAMGLLFLIIFLLAIRFGSFGALPTTEELKNIDNYTASELYDADDQLIGKYYIENRTNASRDELPPYLVDALIATEDARFFDHKGVDMRAMFRVFFKTILGNDRSAGGGSTLSQQLAKNLFPRQRYRFGTIPINKVREMFIARRLESVYSKEALINLYLNTVPFGSNTFGVAVASKRYFNTPVKDLTIEQAAVLIGMLKANTAYHPIRNPERSLGRRNVVLAQMAKYKYLPAAHLDSLKGIPLQTDPIAYSNNEGIATYFREHARHELDEILKNIEAEDGQTYNLYTDGLRVYTTIEADMQRYAEESVQQHLTKLQDQFDTHWKGRKPWGDDKLIDKEVKKSRRYQKYVEQGLSEEVIDSLFQVPVEMTVFAWKGDQTRTMSPLDSVRYYFCMLNAGFMAMNPQTGAILAWVGGSNHKYFKYDHVKSRRQVGSTFKPVVYAEALRQGVQPCDYIHNRLVTYTEYDDWKPENSNREYNGLYSMEGGLTNSVNTVAVSLIMQTQAESVIELAHQMGATHEIPNVPSIALGTADLSLYEMVNIYGTLANKGKRPEPYYIRRIETTEGEILYEYEAPKTLKQVLTEEQALIMTKMMESVVNNGTGRRLRYQFSLNNAIAGKTGTTQSQADGWFVGFTPNIVAGAWVGGEYPVVRFRSLSLGQGANTALPIFARFLRKTYSDKQYARMQRDTFDGLSYDMADLMNCPHYIESEEYLLADDLMEELPDDDLGNGIREIVDFFRNQKNSRVNQNPRTVDIRRQETAEQERIRKQNERVRKKRQKEKDKARRKEKRKKFLKNLFKQN